jgi:hypothetical protein
MHQAIGNRKSNPNCRLAPHAFRLLLTI